LFFNPRQNQIQSTSKRQNQLNYCQLPLSKSTFYSDSDAGGAAAGAAAGAASAAASIETI